jgi:hypothetical protein
MRSITRTTTCLILSNDYGFSSNDYGLLILLPFNFDLRGSGVGHVDYVNEALSAA